jgi:hypothetical protein
MASFRPITWSGNYVRTFGAKNEGFTIEADSVESAKGILIDKYNLNPFYLTIEETQD